MAKRRALAAERSGDPRAIALENVGPIERLSFRVPAAGGVVVLRGRNGSGKSTALRSLENVLDGEKLAASVRDGALGGSLSACGVSIVLGRSTKRAGELEVSSLGDRLNVADLVDPGLVDPVAADERRVKALVQLAGVEVSPELFGASWEYASERTRQAGDLVTAARQLKADLEAEARKVEKQANALAGEAQAHWDRMKACGHEFGESDRYVDEIERAEADRKAALRRQLELEAAVAQASSAAGMLAKWQAELARLESEAKPTKLYEQEIQARFARCEQLQAQVDDINRQIGKLEADRESVLAQINTDSVAILMLRDQHAACTERDQAIAALRQQIADAEALAGPDPAECGAACAALQQAEDACERAKHKRLAWDAYSAAMTARANCEQLDHRAGLIREAAASTHDALSAAVARLACGLRVRDGRLIVDTERGETYYADLSHGERWDVALEIACAQFSGEQLGLIVVPQEAWEGLDPGHRAELDARARARRVVVLTAEATADAAVVAEQFATSAEGA